MPYKIAEEAENTLYRDYVSMGLKILTTNTANFAGGSVLSKTFSEILEPEKDDSEIIPGEATRKIKAKFREGGGETA